MNTIRCKLIWGLFGFMIFFTSCKEKEKIVLERNLEIFKEPFLFGVWKRTKIDHNYKSEIQEKILSENPPRYEPHYFITLFPDRKGAISFKTELDTILWTPNSEEELIILDGNFSATRINLVEFDNDTLLRVIGKSGVEVMTFEKYSNLTTDYTEDPNYPYNNFWRIRAGDLISVKEIEFKVDNYLRHYEMLFKASLDEKSKRRFSNKHTKGILRVYKGKIGITSRDKIGDDWKSYFYSDSEAFKAYDILKKKLKESKTDITKSDNWVKDNYMILRGINNVQ